MPSPCTSIIVAIYNIKDHLPSCLDSLAASGLYSAEVILVDDGSTDGCSTLCDQYAVQYGFHVLHKENGGLSSARNFGLAHMAGKYALFIDGDDTVDSDALNACLQEVERLSTQGIDLLLNDVLLCQGDRCVPTNKIRYASIGRDGLPHYISSPGGLWNVWRAVFSRNLLERLCLQFEEGMLCEDIDFTTQALLACAQPAFVHVPYYRYRAGRPGSIMSETTIIRIACMLRALSRWGERLLATQGLVARALLRAVRREYLASSSAIWRVPSRDRRKARELYQDAQFLCPYPGSILFWSRLVNLAKRIKDSIRSAP